MFRTLGRVGIACLFLSGLVGTLPAQSRGGSSSIGREFLVQEQDFWELEALLLSESLTAMRSSDQASRLTETDAREIIRRGRSSETLRKVKRYINDHLDAETRDLLSQIAQANGVASENIFADYLTVEATIDYSLMASAYNTVRGNNFQKFPADAQRMLETLTRGLTKAPVPADRIQAGNIDGDRLKLWVFGCEINEHIIEVREDNRRQATILWRSNYSFLRDIKDRKTPTDERKDVMTYEDGRWLTSYVNELNEFVESTGRTEWGKKVREMQDIDGYLARRDPLDDRKSRNSRFIYDPEMNDGATRFTSGRDDRRDIDQRDSDRDRNDRSRDDRRRDYDRPNK